MAKKEKKSNRSVPTINRVELTQKWWHAYHELYSKINDLGTYMQSMQGDMENLREISLALGDLTQKDEAKVRPKVKKIK